MIMYLRFHCDLIFKHQIIDKLNILRQLISINTFGKLFHVTKSKLPSCEDALDCARELWPPVLLWPVCSLLEFCCSEDECVPSVAPLPTLSMLRPSLPSPLMNRSKFSWYFVYMQIVYLSVCELLKPSKITIPAIIIVVVMVRWLMMSRGCIWTWSISLLVSQFFFSPPFRPSIWKPNLK